MVKAAADVSPIVDAYVAKVQQKLGVERVVLVDVLTDGVDGEPTDVQFIVVSSAFESMDWAGRIEKLATVNLEVSPLIQAWPYTPAELMAHLQGDKHDGLLAQFLGGSREVHLSPGLTPLETLRKAAGRKP